MVDLIEQYDALNKFFETDSSSNVKSVRFIKIAEAFTSKSLLAKLLFLRNISGLFQGILNLIQRDEPLVHVLYELVQFLKKIMGRFLTTKSFSAIDGANLLSIDVEKGENWLENVEIGLDTENELQKLPISDKKKRFVWVHVHFTSMSLSI